MDESASYVVQGSPKKKSIYHEGDTNMLLEL